MDIEEEEGEIEEVVEENINEKIAVCDIESENWLEFRVLGFFDGTKYLNFFSIEAFLNHINSKEYKGWKFFAHNGGRFDFLFFLEPMLKRRWDIRFIERGGSIIAMIVTTNRSKFTFADSYALIKGSLKKIGQAFKVKHQKKDFKFKEGMKINPHDKKLLSYLKNDCLCLYEVLMAFQKIPNVGKLQLTTASQAMHSFRRFFLDADLYRVPLKDEDLIREKYYSGGRVEVFKGYGKKLNYYDVNSLYPTAMMGMMPCGKIRHVKHYVPNLLGFYEVVIKKTPDWYVSPLIHKIGEKQGKETYYVKGPGTYFVSSAMLEYLKKTFKITFKVKRGIVFSRKEKLFVKYVRYWYSVKERAPKDSALYMLAKIFLNGLYGKFAQARFRESLELVSLQELVNKGVEWRAWDGDIKYGLVLVKRESKSEFILPYIAAWITDQARLIHYKLMNEHPKEIYYCDTDSIITTADYSKHVGRNLGQLSYLGQFEGIFLSPKTYALRKKVKGKWEEKIVFKGFDADKFDWETFKNTMLTGKPLEMETHRILGFRECFSRLPASKLKKPREEPDQVEGKFLKRVFVRKHAEVVYDKRQLIADKKSVFESRPYTIVEAERVSKERKAKKRRKQ